MKDTVKIKVTCYSYDPIVSLPEWKARHLGLNPRECVDRHWLEYNVWMPGDSNFDYTVRVTAYEQDFDYVISSLDITNDYVEDCDKELIERLFDTIFFRGRWSEILCDEKSIEYSIEEMERVCSVSA